MASGQSEYYAKRAQQELAMAEAAKDPCSRQVHRAFAARYARIANGEPIKMGIVERG